MSDELLDGHVVNDSQVAVLSAGAAVQHDDVEERDRVLDDKGDGGAEVSAVDGDSDTAGVEGQLLDVARIGVVGEIDQAVPGHARGEACFVDGDGCRLDTEHGATFRSVVAANATVFILTDIDKKVNTCYAK